MLERARLLGRLSPRWLRLATARELGQRGDLAGLRAVLKQGWSEGTAAMARAWPADQRVRLCAVLLDHPAGWETARELLAEEAWRVAAAWSVLQNRPACLDELVGSFPPADPVARSLLLLFAGRLEEYERLDFDHRHLQNALETAPVGVRTLLLRHAAGLGRPDLVTHHRVPWCQLSWPEFEARLELMARSGGLEKVLPDLRADQAARALELLRERSDPAAEELGRELGGLIPSLEQVRAWLSVPVEQGRLPADYVAADRLAVVTGSKLQVRGWDTPGDCSLPAEGLVEAVFSPDLSRVALAGLRSLRLLDLPDGRLVGSWTEVECFRFGPDQNLAVVCRSGAGTPDRHIVASLFTPQTNADDPPLVPPGRVNSMAVRPDRVAMGLETGEIGLWWGREWALPHMIADQHREAVIFLEFLPGEMLLSATRHEVFLWRMKRPGLPERLQVVARGEFTCFDCRGGRLALGQERGLALWTLSEPGRLEQWVSERVQHVCLTSVGVAACDRDGRVTLYSAEGQRLLGLLGPGVRALTTCRDSLVVLTRSEAVRLSLRQNLIDLPLCELRRQGGKLDGEGFLSRLFSHLHRFSIELGEERPITRPDDVML
ncbi:hypothetical protein DYH09_22560 [bacterium CPR1]|nr:hypothetical protein [bacterium CPR1]